MKALSVLGCVSILALSMGLSACQPKDSSDSVQTVETNTRAQKVEHTTDADIAKLIDIATSNKYGYEITKSLTTEIGARQAGSQQEALAREWAVEKFTALGFANIKTETFTIEGWARDAESAQIVLPSRQNLFVTALGGSVATPLNGIEAPVAFFPTYDDLVAAPEGSLDGKIAYISGRMKKARDGAGYGPANQKRRNGASEAAKRGALAVIIRSVGTDSHRMPHTGQMQYNPEVNKIPIGAVSGPDADQLDRLLSGGTDVTVNLKLATRALGSVTSGNVMAEIVGSEKPEEIILISAHLDSWDLGTGSIDDASGVGIVMGAARTLMESGLKPKRTVRVVLFGSEEIGLKGGFAYAEQHKDELAAHIVATESDFGAGRIYGIQGGKSVASQNLAKEFSANLAGLGIEYIEGATGGGPDVIPMANQGVQTIRLSQDGMDYFDLHHTPDDTFDKIDPEAMAQNTAAYAALVWMISETDGSFKDE
jgi:hypothetical protein